MTHTLLTPGTLYFLLSCLRYSFYTFLPNPIRVSALQRGLPNGCFKNKPSNPFSLTPYPTLFILIAQSHGILWLLAFLFAAVSTASFHCCCCSVMKAPRRSGLGCTAEPPFSSTMPGPLWSASTGAGRGFQSLMVWA